MGVSLIFNATLTLTIRQTPYNKFNKASGTATSYAEAKDEAHRDTQTAGYLLLSRHKEQKSPPDG